MERVRVLLSSRKA